MADWAKILIKTGLIATVMVALFAVFANVQIPAIDYSSLTSGLGVALAVCYHWLPVTSVIFPVAVVLLGVELALLTFRYGMIAVRWLFKVNE